MESRGLWVVDRFDVSGAEPHLVASFYCLHGTLYQSPDLYSVISSHLVRADEA